MKNGGVGFDIGYHLSTSKSPEKTPVNWRGEKKRDKNRVRVWDEKALSEVA